MNRNNQFKNTFQRFKNRNQLQTRRPFNRRRINNAINTNLNRNAYRRRIIQRADTRRIKSNTNNIRRQVNELAKDMDNLTVNATNLTRKKKEPRSDVLKTPMYMCLHQCYISIFPTSNKIIYIPLYTKTTLNILANKTSNLLWFPYGVSFSKINTSVTITINGSDYSINAISTSIFTDGTNFTLPTHNSITEYGNYRLVGATLKLTNVSSMLNKQGDVFIAKLNDNDSWPFAYSKEHPPTPTNAANLVNYYNNYVSKDYTNVTIKNNFSCNEEIYINEYNTLEGNNIFSHEFEYLGDKYANEDRNAWAWPSERNATGNNIKYLVRFGLVANDQKYTLETWQLVEFVPSPLSTMANLGSSVNKLFSSDVVKQMNELNPLLKTSG
jgi:hypothetical protein